mgnify:CR=1 FL=1|tara:strand:- start:1150 stop:1545 length:396 start_codon:yes stop_codon:yes gene_type:complete
MNNMYDEWGCCASCGYSYCSILNKCIRLWLEECQSGHRQLTKLDDFSIDQLMLFIGGVLGSIGALLLIIQKSKCEDITCCCFKCKRRVDLVIAEEKLQMTGSTGLTPKKEENKIDTNNLKLELEEPENENN